MLKFTLKNMQALQRNAFLNVKKSPFVDLSKEIPRTSFSPESFFHVYEKWLRSRKQSSENSQKFKISNDVILKAVEK